MAILVAGSFVHVASSTTATLGAAVQVGDVIVVVIYCSDTTTPTCSDGIGNTYTLQVNATPVADASYLGIFTAPVTVAGTPTITPLQSGGTNFTIDVVAFRGESSATPHKSGFTHETTANPMTVSLTPTVQCTGLFAYTNQQSDDFSSFTLSANLLNHDATFGTAIGYLLGQTPNTYVAGANFSAGNANNTVGVIWLPESPPLSRHVYIIT